MSPAEIVQDYERITGFVDAGPRQLIAAGRPAGCITDDTEQALVVTRLLIAGRGRIDVISSPDELLGWEASMKAGGSLELLGPLTRSALNRLPGGAAERGRRRWCHQRGPPCVSHRSGSPATHPHLGPFLDRVVASAQLTHNTSIGIAAAAAVGAAVSAGIRGGSATDVERVALARDRGERRARWIAGASIAARLRWAVAALRQCREPDGDALLAEAAANIPKLSQTCRPPDRVTSSALNSSSLRARCSAGSR